RLSVYRSALEAKWRMGARNHPGRDAKIYLGKSKTCLSDQIRRMDSRLETAPAGVCGVTRGQGSARSGEGDIARASSLCATGHLAWLSRIWDFYQRAECLLSPQGPSRTGIKCLLLHPRSHHQLVVLHRCHPDMSPQITRVTTPGGFAPKAVVKAAIE